MRGGVRRDAHAQAQPDLGDQPPTPLPPTPLPPTPLPPIPPTSSHPAHPAHPRPTHPAPSPPHRLAPQGVDLDNAGDFLKNGANSIGLVAPLFPADAVAAGNWDVINANAVKVIGNVKAALA